VISSEACHAGNGTTIHNANCSERFSQLFQIKDEELYVPVFSWEQYATDIGNSPKVSAELPIRVGFHGSSLSIKNIAKVFDPALTVNKYYIINLKSQ
jgi:hypothetical protein